MYTNMGIETPKSERKLIKGNSRKIYYAIKKINPELGTKLIQAMDKWQRMASLEDKRIQNINFIMDDVHTSSNNIYENLVDKDFDSLKSEVQSLIKQLKLILESVQDEL